MARESQDFKIIAVIIYLFALKITPNDSEPNVVIDDDFIQKTRPQANVERFQRLLVVLGSQWCRPDVQPCQVYRRLIGNVPINGEHGKLGPFRLPR
jgi:hypothetical protein